MMTHSRRKTVRKISFLTALIVVLAVWGTVNMVAARNARMQLSASRERALTLLGTNLSQISTGLSKGVYASTEPMMTAIAEDIYRASAGAKASLSELTDSGAGVSELYHFLSQAGDYAMAMNKKAAAGETLTKEQTENLLKLRQYAANLSTEVEYLIAEQQSGGLEFEKIESTLSQSTEEASLVLNTELEDTEQVMKDYPTLIYDGPFSDHVGTKKSVLTEGLETVSEEEAAQKAAEFLDVSPDKLYLLGKCESTLPCYAFYNADVTVSVTKHGGLVVSMLTSVFAGESKLGAADAVNRAKAFLEEKGYTKLKDSYYAESDGICTVNFAYYENGIIYYTDLIKVGVALDTGEIVSFDATGYLMNHTERALKAKYRYSAKEASSFLKPSLQVMDVRPAYIPTDFETEVYTYEYHCKAQDGTEVLVYLNPDTGNEEELLILLYSDNGVLTK